LFRGIENADTIKDALNGVNFSDLEPGMTFKNRSLASFSTKESTALKFANSEKGVVFITKTNKGLPIVSLSRQISETERLLKSEYSFKVIKNIKRMEKYIWK
jgi:hypothetical protein